MERALAAAALLCSSLALFNSGVQSGAPQAEQRAEIEPRKPGSEAPAFELTTLDGKKVTSTDLAGDVTDPQGRREKRILVVVFWARLCPWVEKWNPDLQAACQKFASEPRVRFVVIDSDKNEQRDPAAIRKYLEGAKLTFPVYLDAGCKAADAFGATVTPHCFVVGKDGKVNYTGRINDQNPLDEDPASKAAPVRATPRPKNPLLEKAIQAAIDGKTPEVAVDVPMGCRLKRQ